MLPIDSLESQSIFDTIFGSYPTILRLSQRGKTSCATENTEYLAARFLIFLHSCQLNIFCDTVQLQYIGTKSYDSHKILTNITLALSFLKMVSHHKGRTASLIPDDLLNRFVEFLPLLSPSTVTWSFSLNTLFFNALPQELQVAVQQGGFIFPNLFTLIASFSQERELQTLREYSVVAFKNLAYKSNCIEKLVATFSTVKNNPVNATICALHFKNTPQAEATIKDEVSKERPLVKDRDGRNVPQNSSNGYVSQYADGLDGCLGCGSSYHHFRDCPSSRINN